MLTDRNVVAVDCVSPHKALTECDEVLPYLRRNTSSEARLSKIIGWDPNSFNYEAIIELQQKLASAICSCDTVMQFGPACGDLL